MGIYKSPDGRTSLELRQSDYLNENGSKTYCFTCNVNSHGFTAEVENIWFYGDDLLKFSTELTRLIESQKKGKVVLSAMSDFTCSIEPIDSLGHYSIKTTLENSVFQNSASLVTEAETQTISDFAKDLSGIAKTPNKD